jgi:hypothetical protein
VYFTKSNYEIKNATNLFYVFLLLQQIKNVVQNKNIFIFNIENIEFYCKCTPETSRDRAVGSSSGS